MSEEVSKPELYEFDPSAIKDLSILAEKIEEIVAWYGARLVVEAWDLGDSTPIAWIEMHPDDSTPSIRFARPAEEQGA